MRAGMQVGGVRTMQAEQAEAEITELLQQAESGDPASLAAVFESLYPELRRLAASRLRGSANTITPTVLVHEFFLRLDGGERLSLNSRRHFFAYAALTKPASEKMVAPSSTVDSVTSGCGIRTGVNSIAISSTITPTISPRSTAPAT